MPQNMKMINTFKLYQNLNFIFKVAILHLLLFFSIEESNGQNGQYILDASSNSGSPSSVTTNTQGITPFTHNRKSVRSRYLYLANELYNEGADTEGGQISSLAFNISELTADFEITDYNITIAQVSSTTLPNNMNTLPGSVLVKTISSLNITQIGWFEIEFDTFFDWDGISNLVVEICKTNTTVGSPLPSNVKVEATNFSSGDNRTWALYTTSNSSSSANGCSMIASGNPSNTSALSPSSNRRVRPNIRFTFKCNGNPVGGIATYKDESSICVGEDVEIQIVEGEKSSGLLYQWQSSTDGINFINISGANSAKLTVERQEVNMYYKRATACCCSDLTYIDSLPYFVAGINTWDGSFWSFGVEPSDDQPVKITGNFDTAVNGDLIEACSLFIESGTFIVRNEHTVQLKNRIKVAQGAEVIFENNSSLVQEDDLAINEGVIKYKRNSQPLRLLDYTYWSSPVSNQTPISFSPGTPTNRIYHWNHSAVVQNWQNGVHNIPMIAGKGYIIRTPNGFPSTGTGQVFNGLFVGVPNNGEIVVATQGKNSDALGPNYWNLLGNPYPSAIDSHAFLLQNSSKIDGTIHYWTHNSSPSGVYPGSNALNYNSNDYATYNLTGSVGLGDAAGTVTDPNDPSYGVNQQEPGRYIGAGQSFMVAGGEDVGEGTVKFSNSMRTIGENKQFFRTSDTNDSSLNSDNEKHRIWLEVKHENGAFKQTLIGYVEGATNGLDWGFDGKFLGNSPVAIYSVVEDKKLIIQGRGLPFDENDFMPLGFSATIAGSFQLNLYKYDGLFQNQNVFIVDTQTGTIHNIKDGVYSFISESGVFNDRFVLRFTNETLSIDPVDSTSKDLICYSENEIIFIKTVNQNLESINVYDASGRVLSINKNVNSKELTIGNLQKNNQLLLVEVTFENGVKSTRKLIF
mgnify:FL=1